MKLARPTHWASRNLKSWLLYPLSLVFMSLARLRYLFYRTGVLSSWDAPVPVVVVGNIVVGGAGKTPLVLALAKLLQNQSYSVGIVSRGYGGSTGSMPVVVAPDSDPAVVGDESIMLAARSGLPVVVCTKRVSAVQLLLSYSACDIVLCDDGLQHYALKRDLEIAVVDSEYLYGNQFCLPAGPLREPVARLASVDLVVQSGRDRLSPGYELQGSTLVNLADQSLTRTLESFSGGAVHAVAGIGSPQRFFDFLTSQGLTLYEHAKADHAVYQRSDLEFDDDLPVILTEKDAVKCRQFGFRNCWYLPVYAVLDQQIEHKFLSSAARVTSEKKALAN